MIWKITGLYKHQRSMGIISTQLSEKSHIIRFFQNGTQQSKNRTEVFYKQIRDPEKTIQNKSKPVHADLFCIFACNADIPF